MKKKYLLYSAHLYKYIFCKKKIQYNTKLLSISTCPIFKPVSLLILTVYIETDNTNKLHPVVNWRRYI